MPGDARGRPGLVLALGGGGARGLAHVGVVEVLAQAGLPVRAVAGTSIGAEIGAFLAAGMSVARMREVATAFDWKLTLQLFLPDLPGGGLVSGTRILAWLAEQLGGKRIEELDMGFAAVATDLEAGEGFAIVRDDSFVGVHTLGLSELQRVEALLGSRGLLCQQGVFRPH